MRPWSTAAKGSCPHGARKGCERTLACVKVADWAHLLLRIRLAGRAVERVDEIAFVLRISHIRLVDEIAFVLLHAWHIYDSSARAPNASLSLAIKRTTRTSQARRVMEVCGGCCCLRPWNSSIGSPCRGTHVSVTNLPPCILRPRAAMHGCVWDQRPHPLRTASLTTRPRRPCSVEA
jgi:hypothetical protein